MVPKPSTPSFPLKMVILCELSICLCNYSHRNMIIPNIAHGFTRVGSVASHWKFRSSVIVLFYEGSVTLEFCIGFSSMHHLYMPLLGSCAKGGEISTLPTVILGDTKFPGPRDVYPYLSIGSSCSHKNWVSVLEVVVSYNRSIIFVRGSHVCAKNATLELYGLFLFDTAFISPY
jgi:hypothetical protein